MMGGGERREGRNAGGRGRGNALKSPKYSM